jgi:hypothetical protein
VRGLAESAAAEPRASASGHNALSLILQLQVPDRAELTPSLLRASLKSVNDATLFLQRAFI